MMSFVLHAFNFPVCPQLALLSLLFYSVELTLKKYLHKYLIEKLILNWSNLTLLLELFDNFRSCI